MPSINPATFLNGHNLTVLNLRQNDTEEILPRGIEQPSSSAIGNVSNSKPEVPVNFQDEGLSDTSDVDDSNKEVKKNAAKKLPAASISLASKISIAAAAILSAAFCRWGFPKTCSRSDRDVNIVGLLTKESIEKVEREISSILEIKNPSELEVQNLKELHKSIVENSKGNSGLAHKCLDEIVKIKAKIGEVDINKAYEDLEAQLEALKKTKKGRVSFQQIQDLALSVRFCSHSLSVCPSQGSDGTCRSSKVLRGIMDRIFTELKSEKKLLSHWKC